MRDVYSIGQRDGKYMKHQINTAPLVDRSACQYTQDFVALPLDDHKITRQIADGFKNRQPAFGRNKQPFCGATKYSEDYKRPTSNEGLRARQESSAPERGLTKTLPSEGNLLENISHEQNSFKSREQAWCKATKALKPPTTLTIGEFTVPTVTSYNEQFGSNRASKRSRPKRTRSAPSTRPPQPATVHWSRPQSAAASRSANATHLVLATAAASYSPPSRPAAARVASRSVARSGGDARGRTASLPRQGATTESKKGALRPSSAVISRRTVVDR